MLTNYKGLIITGPTASGKTKLSIEIALWLKNIGYRSVIINADSKQIYSQVPIITAQPTIEEQKGVGHKLFSFLNNKDAFNNRYSAANWVSDVNKIVEEAQINNTFVIIVGGSMFYIGGLINGFDNLPEIDKYIEQKAMQNYNNYGHDEVVKIVKQFSPNTKTDKQRLIKNYCYILQYQQPVEYFYSNKNNNNGNTYNDSFEKIVLLPQREDLYRWCNERFSDMIVAGVVEEVKNIITNEFGNFCSSDIALQDYNKYIADAIYTTSGFKHIVKYINGEIGKEEMIEKSCQDTRNYAKRQITWINNKLDKTFKIADSKQECRKILNIS